MSVEFRFLPECIQRQFSHAARAFNSFFFLSTSLQRNIRKNEKSLEPKSVKKGAKASSKTKNEKRIWEKNSKKSSRKAFQRKSSQNMINGEQEVLEPSVGSWYESSQSVRACYRGLEASHCETLTDQHLIGQA